MTLCCQDAIDHGLIVMRSMATSIFGLLLNTKCKPTFAKILSHSHLKGPLLVLNHMLNLD